MVIKILPKLQVHVCVCVRVRVVWCVCGEQSIQLKEGCGGEGWGEALMPSLVGPFGTDNCKFGPK